MLRRGEGSSFEKEGSGRKEETSGEKKDGGGAVRNRNDVGRCILYSCLQQRLAAKISLFQPLEKRSEKIKDQNHQNNDYKNGLHTYKC